MKKLKFSQLDDKYKSLVKEAINVKKMARTNITHFSVGASILLENGEIISGCNVEFSTLAPSICAERNAISTMIANGKNKFDVICICGDKPNTFPCGVCRQTIYEINDEAIVLVVNSEDEILMTDIKTLLPEGFKYE